MTKITEISTHRPGNSTLTDGDVVAIRTQYQAMRREAESSVDKWCDLTTTDQALATQYGVNPATITNLVLGRSRISAGGPVDTDRRVEMETYQADVKAYGRPEANVRRRFRQRLPALPKQKFAQKGYLQGCHLLQQFPQRRCLQ